MSNYRIAFVMGGGVSLGAFSGGALAQVMSALARTQDATEHSFEIDVLAGASAGAITLALAAHELMAGRDPSAELRRLWVGRLDVRELYAADLDEHREPALFASKLLQTELERLVRDLDKPPHAGGGANSIIADEVALGFSLSNMNGFAFEVPLEVGSGRDPGLGDAATTRIYSDERRFLVTSKTPPTDSMGMDDDFGMWVRPDDENAWRMIADTAVTSGAFPAAFSPRVIARHKNEYGKNWDPSLGDKELFAYVDGGLFNNEPLRMAIDMARKMDGRNSGDAERIFIVIDPTISADKHTGSPRFFVEDDVAISGPAGAIDVLKTVAGAVQGEATAKDWMKASRKNHELEWFEKSTKHLAEVVAALPSEFESKELTKTLRGQVDDVIRTKFHATVGRPLDDAQQVKRYRETQASLLEKRHEGTTDGMSAKQKELFIAFVAMLENAAGLRKKEKLRLLGIAPEVVHPPAGRFLESFGGFFDNSIRAHDYQLGRSAADRVLQASSFCDFVPDATAAPPAKLERGYDDLSGITQQLFESYTGRFVLKALKAPENWATKAAAKVVARFAVRWAGRKPEDPS